MYVHDSECPSCTTKSDEETGAEMSVSLLDGCVIKAAETILSRVQAEGYCHVLGGSMTTGAKFGTFSGVGVERSDRALAARAVDPSPGGGSAGDGERLRLLRFCFGVFDESRSLILFRKFFFGGSAMTAICDDRGRGESQLGAGREARRGTATDVHCRAAAPARPIPGRSSPPTSWLLLLQTCLSLLLG
jgi:hypothetical protein